jgi:hypothetical protein
MVKSFAVPDVSKRVKAIVPDRETIYCSNKNCKLADPGIKAIQKTEQSTRSQIKRPKSVSTDFQPNHPEQPEEHQHSARNIQQKGRLALVGAL